MTLEAAVTQYLADVKTQRARELGVAEAAITVTSSGLPASYTDVTQLRVHASAFATAQPNTTVKEFEMRIISGGPNVLPPG